jgi:hypothetical protein
VIVTKVEMPDSANTPVRKSVRRLRWFKEAVQRQIDALSEQTGVKFSVDDKELHSLFLRWLESFEAQKPSEDGKKEDYVNFASGLMLRELINSKPARVTTLPDDADKSNPAYFWPEGYLYVVLCLNIRAAVLEQDFNIKKHVVPEMDEVRTWWSFKENMHEDPNLAIGFFDLFSGIEPSWDMPTIFSARKGRQVAVKYLVRSDNLLKVQSKIKLTKS